MSAPQPTPETQDAPRSPFAGCLIFIVIGIVVAVLISSAAYSVKNQTQAFTEFAETVAKPAPIADLATSTDQLSALQSRLTNFQNTIAQEQAATLKLSPEDLNLAIAHFDDLQDLRSQFHVQRITPTELSGTLHLPLRSTEDLPGFLRSILSIEARDNFLNGTFTGNLLLTDGKLFLNLTSITPTIGELPEPFFQGINRPLISGEPAEDQEPNTFQTALKPITSLELSEGFVIASYRPDQRPPSVKIEADALATKAKHFVALGAVLFILTMILSFILLSRRAKRKRAIKTN